MPKNMITEANETSTNTKIQGPDSKRVLTIIRKMKWDKHLGYQSSTLS